MCYQLDAITEVYPGLSYMPVSSHRRVNNAHKSWWAIKVEEEVTCFLQAHALNVLMGGNGWGMHLGSDAQPLTLGYCWGDSRPRPLKVAKFVNKNRSAGPWHGYPADYQRKPQDLPPVKVLLRWVGEGYIEKHDATRIRRGIRCL